MLTIVSILALFAYSFLGTTSPLDLIHYDDIRFSYTGTPTYTYLFSNAFNTGLSGINGTETNLTLREGATLELYPVGDVRSMPENDTGLTKEGNKYRTRIGPGEEARVYITVSKSDEYNANMRLSYSDSDNETITRCNRAGNVTWLTRKSDDQYVLNAIYLPGAHVSFSVIDTVKDWHTDESRWNYFIRINIDRLGENGQPSGRGHLRSYEYNGTIQVLSDGQFWLRSPVNKLSPIYCEKMELEKAEGDLDIQHNGHDCSPADSITAYREAGNINKTIKTALLSGRIFASGEVDSINFREKEYADPIVVIIKEGNFAILTGLLSSFLTITLARLIANIKKK